jgi:hypothetical protein
VKTLENPAKAMARWIRQFPTQFPKGSEEGHPLWRVQRQPSGAVPAPASSARCAAAPPASMLPQAACWASSEPGPAPLAFQASSSACCSASAAYLAGHGPHPRLPELPGGA